MQRVQLVSVSLLLRLPGPSADSALLLSAGVQIAAGRIVRTRHTCRMVGYSVDTLAVGRVVADTAMGLVLEQWVSAFAGNLGQCC